MPYARPALWLCAELTLHLTSPFRTSMPTVGGGGRGEGRGRKREMSPCRFTSSCSCLVASLRRHRRNQAIDRPTSLPTGRPTLPDGNRSTKAAFFSGRQIRLRDTLFSHLDSGCIQCVFLSTQRPDEDFFVKSLVDGVGFWSLLG